MSGFRTSNQLSDRLLALLTGEEWKVVYYIIRRTFGLSQPEGNRISLREFATGYFMSGTRMDYGTGLSVSTVEKALSAMRQFGVVREVMPRDERAGKAAMYRVEIKPEAIDIAGLERRQKARQEAASARTEAARGAKSLRTLDTPSVAQNGGPPRTVAQNPPPLSDSNDPFCRTEPTPSVPQNPLDRHGERQGESQGTDKGDARGNSGKRRKALKDSRSDTAAIQAVRFQIGRYPPKELWDRTIEVLGGSPDALLLKTCREEWIARGFNPVSWVWLLEWYPNGGPIDRDYGKGGNGKSNGATIEPGKYAGR